MNGEDSCVITFGHNGMGHENSMIGLDRSVQTLGIIPCAISWLYRLIHEKKQRSGIRCTVRLSAVEVGGHNEELRDLLVHQGYTENSSATVTQNSRQTQFDRNLNASGLDGSSSFLENLSELRAPSADKAAFYLDVALAGRRFHTKEERRNSHFRFSINVYQYKVDHTDEGKLVGGRSRLHLVDLGTGEKCTKPDRASLSLPAIGNVLVTLLQGQRYLPSRDSNLTSLLKDSLSTVSCKSIYLLASVLQNPEFYMETLNTIQIVSRIYKIKRIKKSKVRDNFIITM
ncbi:unnamed protein product [Soboliphyme baturini]|uniref:Kinesin motor domain-containing protein n=1 Tax=Soboliphyme baturini TaxID=241478 RepID=A0A183J6K8_9BILA|nr:unnamed protein product [Soboliphyme baturini]